MKPLTHTLLCMFLATTSFLLVIGLVVVSARPAAAATLRQSTEVQALSPQGASPTVLVHFAEGTPAETRAALVAEMGGELVTWMEQINVAEVRLPPDRAVAGAVNVANLVPMSAAGLVTHAEPNMAVSATYVPNDPDFNDATMSYGLNDVQALAAWDVVTGSQEIIVAVIDSGIMAEHPEFAGRVLPGYDFIDNDAEPEDDSGHGTHVAGIIAAALDNGQGTAGVCPNCTLLPVKVLNENNLGSWSQLAQGILYAVDQGARILNLSLGADVSSETLAVAIDYALESGAVVVAAAGNYGSDRPFYPAALEGVIAVGATTSRDQRWARSDFGDYIDLVAPGYLIYSAFHDLDNIYRGYTFMSGTSMAAPFVSGVAGLLLSIAPTLSAEDVGRAMILGAQDLGPEDWDPDFGYGRVDAWGALRSPVEGLVEAVGEAPLPNQQSFVFLPVVSNP